MRLSRSQVSLEYLMLFGLLFFIFVTVVATIGIFLPRLDAEGDQVLDELQMKAIQASLARSGFESKVLLPQGIKLEIYPDPDNMILLKNNAGGVSRRFLPAFYASGSGDTIIIKKASGGIEIKRE